MYNGIDGNGNPTDIVQNEPLAPNLQFDATLLSYNATRNRLVAAGTESFTYDDEGQLATWYNTSYSFDYEHRLVGVGATISYQYDGIGNRLQAVRNGETTRYIYDQKGNLLAEADGSNNILRYYIHGLGLLAMVTPAGATYCYHFNPTGSVIAMTNMSKVVVNKYAYTPFGTIATQEETVSQPFKFVGQYGVMSEPNGFYYMRARYYDPQVGRFISEDPIGFGGGDLNLYAYVGNVPIRFIDPSGLVKWDRVGLGTIEAAAGGLGVAAAATAEVASAGAATALAGGIAAFAVLAFSHGISEIIAGSLDSSSPIPPVSAPSVAALAITGDVNRSQEVDIIASTIMVGGSIGSWAASTPRLIEVMSSAAELANIAVQSKDLAPRCGR